ncbi:MAG TPA: HAMP domain-containing sensor histidine kinase [Lapillicoccus sp.]|uniref:sensor histidine kinase n=1 Tax=Lapillicoccus sp. TaxID=1909287 RepID=UPI002F9361C1
MRASVAERWRRAVIGTSYVAISPQDLAEVLRGLVEELDGLLLDRKRSAAGGAIVGNQLVEAHLTNPRSLSLTLQVLLGATDELTGGQVGLGERWGSIVASVAEGYTTALRDLVLREQEEMLTAAIAARDFADDARWEAERQLEQTKQDFIATISHELRTPLTPIKGYLRMLLSLGDQLSREQRTEFYQIMLSQTELLQRLLDDLLSAASGPGNIEFTVTPTKTDIARIVRRAIDAVDPESTRQVNWSGDDAVGTAVCDPLRLRQVLAALLRNADLYSTPGEPVDVSARRAGHHVEIRVRDYGPGIPKHLALAVFEPFRRLGRGTVPGTGLGLYIARQLTQAMSGQIWVSDAHPGAEFHILIPTDPE